MKKLLITALAALALTACATSHRQAEYSGAKGIGYAEAVRMGDVAVKKIRYPVAEQETLYFSDTGEPVAQAADGKFMRKVLGKTKDGLMVVQDFYADGKKQSNAFILAKDEEIGNFIATRAHSGVVNSYLPDGKLAESIVYQNGKLVQKNIYRNGRLFAMKSKQNNGYVVILSENGDKRLEMLEADTETPTVRYFYANGQLGAEWGQDEKTVTQYAKMWDEYGNSLDKDAPVDKKRGCTR
ncbi:hypothetical protein [Neisseria perflava]|uniref:hypothetical protein n=1 Tax=Neisseria perflava TaxID=33053 RepID=UPI00209C9F83|nr:hypothetical protein [Neisseria perflava]MCP1661254.1 antitoxin component YwqK of YwqJK toxin-antitoxin module [Neisseria perflava]